MESLHVRVGIMIAVVFALLIVTTGLRSNEETPPVSSLLVQADEAYTSAVKQPNTLWSLVYITRASSYIKAVSSLMSDQDALRVLKVDLEGIRGQITKAESDTMNIINASMPLGAEHV